MRKHTKLILMALTAALLLSFAAGTASARSSLTASPNNILIIFPELTFGSALGEVICEVTLHVTLNRTIAKRAGTVGGSTTVGVGSPCEGGSAGLLVNERRVTGLQGPYSITYQRFGGELPNIESVTIQLVGLVFWIELEEFICLSRNNINGITTGGNPATGLEANQSGLPLTGGFLCSLTTGELIGRAPLSSNVTIGLI